MLMESHSRNNFIELVDGFRTKSDEIIPVKGKRYPGEVQAGVFTLKKNIPMYGLTYSKPYTGTNFFSNGKINYGSGGAYSQVEAKQGSAFGSSLVGEIAVAVDYKLPNGEVERKIKLIALDDLMISPYSKNFALEGESLSQLKRHVIENTRVKKLKNIDILDINIAFRTAKKTYFKVYKVKDTKSFFNLGSSGFCNFSRSKMKRF